MRNDTKHNYQALDNSDGRRATRERETRGGLGAGRARVEGG